MHDEHFFKKKQLLAQRDQLLEEIGEGVFNSGELPPEFKDLPKEFKGMDIVLRKLKERLRLFREDRDRKIQELREAQDEMAAVEKAYVKDYEPCKQDFEERTLKLEYQTGHKKASRDDTQAQEEALEACRTKLERIKSDHRKQVAAFWKKTDPMERQIHRVEKAMLEVQTEMEGLASSRSKRLQDLGYWFHHRKPNSYGPEYAQLKLLRLELTEFKALEENPQQRMEAPQELPERKEAEKWRMPLVLLLTAVFIGYFFRTDFSEADLSMGAVAISFLEGEADSRVYADLNDVETGLITTMLPDLESLPGGDITFRNMRSEDIQQFLYLNGGDGGDELLCFGVRFRRPPPRFVLRLKNAGWRYQPSVRNWKALSDGNWVWVVLNERSFFLLPKDKEEAFVKLNVVATPNSLYIDHPMSPPGNDAPLLQGFERFRLNLTNADFKLAFSRDRVPLDLNLRQQWLARHQGIDPLDIQLEENVCTISGPRAFLGKTPFTATDLLAKVQSALNTPMLADEAVALTMKGAPEQLPLRNRLLVMKNGEQPDWLADLPLAGNVKDIAYHNTSESLLVLSDEGLYRYRVGEQNVRYDCVLEDSRLPSNFRAERMLISPDETVAVLLEQGRSGGQTRLALVGLAPLKLLDVEPLVRDAASWHSAAWNIKGSTLYLGSPGRKTTINRSMIVVYQREGASLFLKTIVPVEMGVEGTWLTNLTVHPQTEHLYYTAQPAERLLRRDLNSKTTLKLDLRQSLELQYTNPLDGSGLILNRDGRRALVIASTGAEDEDGLRGVHLIDVSSQRLTLLDTLEPGFSAGSLWRQPLSDQVWVLGDHESLAHVLEIKDGRLLGRTLLSLGGVLPRLITADRFGETIFIVGPPI